ncbi:ATP-binding protein [Spirosoma soli]|uniref:ATP-binding protein n=1 Tax=Spirosoma soli TaxID=1770529 RepID=A0ABW5MBZ2_9BACT
MGLIERAEFLASLHVQFEKTSQGEGHCVFIAGEAGIGKTSLVKAFCQPLKDSCQLYLGTCDALFSPRPLAPLYDIALQMGNHLWENSKTLDDRAILFSQFFGALSSPRQRGILVFEDIHWADEATLDFIKFFSRRITQTACLFLLTYRDNEIHARHPLRNVLGELVPGSFTRLTLPSLSKQAVEKLAQEKGYKGEDVYSISGGNPFYVQEILASYSPGIPDNIKDSILFVYNRQDETTKFIWEILSVLPTGLESNYLVRLDTPYEAAIERSLESRILLLHEGRLQFKHELYRRTIEQSLSPLKRVALNKRILDLFRLSFEESGQIERIIHHAKNANEYELVAHYAPLAARQAASVGAHIEASKLYLSAIEYYQGADKDVLLHWYEAYAYECYLTNQIKEAIIYQGKALTIWRQKDDLVQVGNSLRFLSRLWWFEGNHAQSEHYALAAITALADQPDSSIKAMAYSNLSQLYMLQKKKRECLVWGAKAIDMATRMKDDETLCHALNNTGSVQLRSSESQQIGRSLLEESLRIALANGYHEHVARAYTNLISIYIATKDYELAAEYMDEGLRYCEERDLDSWTTYKLSWKARMLFETGAWSQAMTICQHLLQNQAQPPVVKIGTLTIQATIGMRCGEPLAKEWLDTAKKMAFATEEYQRVLPVMIALLELEWLTDECLISDDEIDQVATMLHQVDELPLTSEYNFWLQLARRPLLTITSLSLPFELVTEGKVAEAAQYWQAKGCAYEAAIVLFQGTDAQKREALKMVQAFEAVATIRRMKQDMQSARVRNIPRGKRPSTKSNPAGLTNRELEILQLLRQSLQNKEIADRLFISAKTVDHHISSILGKLNVHSRAKAVQEALRLGILK